MILKELNRSDSECKKKKENIKIYENILKFYEIIEKTALFYTKNNYH